MNKDEAPVIVEQTFNCSAEDIWAAITDVEKMKLWFFDNIPDFKPVAGFKTEFNVNSGERDFLHQWEITEVIDKKLIKYSWKYKGYSGDSFVLFEISGQGDQSKLRVSTEIVEDFPDNIPEFTRESCLGGWSYFINQRLKEYMH